MYSPSPSPPPPRGCTHSGDFTRDREFDSNVSYFLILIKACSIFVYTHFTWFFCPFTLVDDMWEDEYTPFGPKSSGVHPTNSQSMPLPMSGFEYVNGLLPIYYNPFRPKVGIIAHLVVSDLWSVPLALRSLPTLRDILDPINKRVPFYISCLFNHISCVHLILKDK